MNCTTACPKWSCTAGRAQHGTIVRESESERGDSTTPPTANAQLWMRPALSLFFSGGGGAVGVRAHCGERQTRSVRVHLSRAQFPHTHTHAIHARTATGPEAPACERRTCNRTRPYKHPEHAHDNIVSLPGRAGCACESVLRSFRRVGGRGGHVFFPPQPADTICPLMRISSGVCVRM